MSRINLINPVTVTVLVTLVSAFVLIQLWGSQLNDLAQKVFVLTLYGLLIGGYVLRVALIFLGVFAVYRMLSKRVNDQHCQANEGLSVLSQNNQPTF